MEIRQFEYFVAIVREGSISRASRRLHVSQPALSKQIQSLEHELGVQLLTRVPEGVVPTDAGQRLSEMSDFILNYINDIRSSVLEAATDLRGTVSIGVSPSLMPELAQQLTGAFAEKHPQLEVQLTEGLPMFLSEWLDMGRLDVGIFTRWAPHDDLPRLEFTDLALDEVLLVGTPDTLAIPPGHAIGTQDLGSVPLALTPGFRDLLRTGLRGTDTPEPVNVTEIDSLHMVRNLVLRGEYCSALPYAYVRDDLVDGSLVATSFEPAIHRQIVAVTRAGRGRSSAVRAIISSARSRLVELELSRAAESR
ncbi:LysR family transcriptional regulator [Aeromicrobium sp. P5_D10]